jgi:glucose-1-phosphate cytidylyltransferase
MKVVLFCGGYGMRMRDGLNNLPKPMAMVGERPLIWHVMRYYAHFGHRDFILCMGYGASHITDYFLHYDETRSNDFVIDQGQVALLNTDVADWRITFVHTGLDTPIGERLRRVRDHLAGEDMFLANYADVLTDAPLDLMVKRLRESTALASLMAVRPQAAFHLVDVDSEGSVTDVRSVADMPWRENAGYFVMRSEILDELRPGEDLMADTMLRLSRQGRVIAYSHDGFWMPADTVKERAALEALSAADRTPWQLWQPSSKPLVPSLVTDPPVAGVLGPPGALEAVLRSAAPLSGDGGPDPASRG